MSFRKRGFQELVDDILTDLTGGVVNEPVRFNVPSNGLPTFPLENTPVARITSVTGTNGGVFFQFSDTDYELAPDRTAIRWLKGGKQPDEGTIFLVDYYPDGARSPITDRNVGSVARTLVEAFGREIATLYEQLELVYKSGFLELAEGSSLDNVVALLALRRIRAGREVGEIVFARSTPAPGDITIPAGTIVVTPPQGEKQEVFEFETTATRTMRQGQSDVAAPIRFRPTLEQQAAFASAQLPPNTITLLPKPIVGIETVSNPEATARGAEDETDEQLRLRTSKTIAEAGKSTIDALRATVLSFGPGVSVVAQDLPSGVPGEVKLVIDGPDSDERRADILRALLATKAAGVMVLTNYTEKVRVKLKLRIETRDDVRLAGDEQRSIETAMRAAVEKYINNLKAGEDLARDPIVALGLADTRLRKVLFEDLKTWRTSLGEATIDTGTRMRDSGGALTSNLASFDHISIGESEKAEVQSGDVIVTVKSGAAEVTTAVRFKVLLAGAPTAAGAATTAESIQPQVATLVKGFIESPDRGSLIKIADLISFIVKSSGLFTLKPHPASFFTAEHLGTGQIDRNAAEVALNEKERAELDSLTLVFD